MTPFEQVEVIVKQISGLLAGQSPEIVGAALADIVGTYFASHNPEFRPIAIELWQEMMADMIIINESIIKSVRGENPWPNQNRSEQ